MTVLVAVVAAACIGRETVGQVPPSAAAPTPEPSVSVAPAPSQAAASPSASVEPSVAPSAAPSVAPTSAPVASPSATPAGTSGPASLCKGNQDNRDFFGGAADNVEWAVYCPVMEGRWFVQSGTYQLARGGWLLITYVGPGGASIDFSEGAFCEESDGCVPTGIDAGEAAFGDRVGTFVQGDDGSYSIVVDRGKDVSWLATGTDIDEDTFRAIVAGLNRVTP